MPLARRLASRYSGGAEPFDDLVQVASVGLVKAIDRFDPERGTAFSTFAVPTILGELKRHFRDRGWSIHVPREVQERILKVERASAELPARLGRAATVDDIAERLDISTEQVLEAMHASQGHHAVSLDASPAMGDGEEPAPLGERIGSQDIGLRDGRVRGLDRGCAGRDLRPRSRDPAPALRRGSDPERDRRAGGRLADARLADSAHHAGGPAGGRFGRGGGVRRRWRGRAGAGTSRLPRTRGTRPGFHRAPCPWSPPSRWPMTAASRPPRGSPSGPGSARRLPRSAVRRARPGFDPCP